MRKHNRELKKLAKRYGFRVEQGKTHFRLVCESGKFQSVTCAGSPSDGNAIRQVERQLRKVVKGEVLSAGPNSHKDNS